MNALVIFDSQYGNTQLVAQKVAETLHSEIVAVTELLPEELAGYDLLVFGAPVHGGQASDAMKAYLSSLNRAQLSGRRVAVFDTRMEEAVQKKPLQLLMKVIGYAAPKMNKAMRDKGAYVAGEAGFIVTGREGPLKEGELERAQVWAKSLIT